MAEGGSGCSVSVPDFDGWVLSNGGDQEFLQILHEHGFKSILSLSNLDINSSESSQLSEALNCGQRCLLRGLIQAAKRMDTYAKGEQQASELSSKTYTIREKLNKLFGPKSNIGTSDLSASDSGGPSREAEGDVFLPTPRYRPPAMRKRSSKGKEPMNSSKKKVKEVRIRVVGLTTPRVNTPVGAERDWHTKTIWIRGCASASEVASKIKDSFGWSGVWEVNFQYVNGRYMRPASLDDIENATSWDAETVKALMGSGCLYVLRTAVEMSASAEPKKEDPESEEEDNKSQVLHLSEMFPAKSKEYVENVFKEFGYSGAVDKLTEVPDNVVPPNMGHGSSTSYNVADICKIVDPKPPTLYHLLRSHAEKIIDIEHEYKLCVDRSSEDELWQAAIAFYKGAKLKPLKLRRELMIEYVGEVGVDSGALRKEFFEAVIVQANKRLFEGEPDRRIPKKDWGLELMFEMCGMMVGQSILQEGPGLPCLSPCIFDYMVHEEVDRCYPVKEDLPLNISTHQLITFIEEMSDASTEDQIDNLVDRPTNSYILNGCGWSPTEPIVPANKLHFLQHLMLDEVIVKRERNLKAFICDLKVLGIADMVKLHPSLTKELFMSKTALLTPDEFMKLIASQRPHKPEEIQTFEMFRDYVSSLKDSNLHCLLRFVTGVSNIPPMGLDTPIELSYLPQDEKEIFPKAQACFSKLHIPTIYDSKEKFAEAFHKALTFGFGYGSA